MTNGAGAGRPGAAPTPSDDELLTVEEAAERYNFSLRRLRQRLALGAFPGARRVTTDGGADWIIPASSFSALGYSRVQALPGPPSSGGQPPEAEALEAARAQLEAERRILEAERRELEADRRQLETERRHLAAGGAAPASEAPPATEETTTPPPGSASMETRGS